MMNSKILKSAIQISLLFFIFAIVIGCIFNEQAKDSLPFIDVSKNYPEKEIILTDIADVSYVHLNSENDDFLYKGRINYMTDNTIVVFDNSSGSILFFTKEGNPKSRFNRYGAGPEEYGMRPLIFYDETKDEVYVVNNSVNYIQIYSSIGEYKRKLTLPHQTNLIYDIVFFDEESLLIYEDSKRMRNMQIQFAKKLRGEASDFIHDEIDSSLFLISKHDGKVLEYLELHRNQKENLAYEIEGRMIGMPTATRIAKFSEGFFLCHPESDTIFLYRKDKSLTPVIHKRPLISKLNPKVYLDNCMEAGNYQFMKTETLIFQEEKPHRKYYLRDKKTGEVFLQKIILPDYKGERSFFIYPVTKCANEKDYFCVLDLFELKQAYNANKLGGKLKELVATLNELEDNEVYILVRFK